MKIVMLDGQYYALTEIDYLRLMDTAQELANGDNVDADIEAVRRVSHNAEVRCSLPVPDIMEVSPLPRYWNVGAYYSIRIWTDLLIHTERALRSTPDVSCIADGLDRVSRIFKIYRGDHPRSANSIQINQTSPSSGTVLTMTLDSHPERGVEIAHNIVCRTISAVRALNLPLSVYQPSSYTSPETYRWPSMINLYVAYAASIAIDYFHDVEFVDSSGGVMKWPVLGLDWLAKVHNDVSAQLTSRAQPVADCPLPPEGMADPRPRFDFVRPPRFYGEDLNVESILTSEDADYGDDYNEIQEEE